jgi:hypothetical protein
MQTHALLQILTNPENHRRGNRKEENSGGSPAPPSGDEKLKMREVSL